MVAVSTAAPLPLIFAGETEESAGRNANVHYFPAASHDRFLGRRQTKIPPRKPWLNLRSLLSFSWRLFHINKGPLHRDVLLKIEDKVNMKIRGFTTNNKTPGRLGHSSPKPETGPRILIGHFFSRFWARRRFNWTSVRPSVRPILRRPNRL